MHLHLFRNARNWDSCLLPIDDNTFGLILQFKIRLLRIEPTTRFFRQDTFGTGNGIIHDLYGTFNLDPWTDIEWEAYKTRFVQVVQRHWSDRFILDPNKDWYSPRARSAMNPASIQCGLSIQLVESSAQAHQTYRIIHPRETNFRSYAEPELRSGLFTHRDLESHWNDWPTRVGTAMHDVGFLQTTIHHEFGHTLGLDHVMGAGNGNAAYGTTLEQRENQMGMGGLLTTRHSKPWTDRLRSAHLINHNHYDSTVQFTGRMASMQLIEYWDNDWQPPAATAPTT